MSEMNSKALVVWCALLALACSCAAWGPVTHYSFACSSVYSHEPWEQCVAAASSAAPPRHAAASPVSARSLLIGSSTPDAFFFGAQPFMIASDCPSSAPALHDPVFAAYLVQWAIDGTVGGSSGSFDAVAFAKGFGSHVMSDMVGFAFKDGYFMANPVALVNDNIDWLYTWPLMLAVDAYYFTNTSLGSSPDPLPQGAMSPEAAEMLVRAIERYHALNPAAPLLSLREVTACNDVWSEHLAAVFASTRRTSSATAGSLVLAYDPYRGSLVEEATHAVELQRACAVNAVKYWLNEVAPTNGAPTDPQKAFLSTMSFIRSMYATGTCTPSL